MAKTPKTKLVKVLQFNYGYGWDDLCEYNPKEINKAVNKSVERD